MTRSRDLLGVVESAYRLVDSDEQWLRDLTAEVQPLLDVGNGIASFYFDARDPAKLDFTKPIVLGARRGAGLALATALRLLPSPMVRQAFFAPTWMTTASEAFGLGERLLDFVLAKQFGHRMGCYDILGFKVDEPTGEGVIMLVALRDIRSVSKRETATWGMCASHVGAALRLRRQFGAKGFGGAEAVLETDGRCAHAEGPAETRVARDALREAVLASERARGSMRRTDPDDALELWKALVAGRWSLVEHFDSDGHRYLVAKRNDPELEDPRGLSLRERQVVAYAALGHPSKLIGYDLGLAPATVSKHLTSAMRKLRVRTHAELMQAVTVTTPARG
jgi:DNA-binding CsgD family transcriptional regulator